MFHNLVVGVAGGILTEFVHVRYTCFFSETFEVFHLVAWMPVHVFGSRVQGMLELHKLALSCGGSSCAGCGFSVGAVDGKVVPFQAHQALIHIVLEDGGFGLVGKPRAEGAFEVGEFGDDHRGVDSPYGEGVSGGAAVDVVHIFLFFQRAAGTVDLGIVGTVV